MLRSTFAGFTTAQLAMRASQKALDITGQNIANINTIGYTRQRLDVISIHATNGDATSIGFGVDIRSISQVRDPFLDVQYRSQIVKIGTSDAKQGGIDYLVDIFDETTKPGIKSALQSISTSLKDLSLPTHTGNPIYDNAARATFQTLVENFHMKATDLAAARKEATDKFKDIDVKNVNTILEEISKLNSQIKSNEILGNPALELKDQRNNMLDDLAGYLPIEIKYTTEKYGVGTEVDILNVSFRGPADANNPAGVSYSLISGNKHGRFDADVTGKPVKLSLTPTGAAATDPKIDLTTTLTNGVFKGSLEMLNESGELSGDDTKGFGYYEKMLDSFAATLAKTFNDLNKDKDGNDHPLLETSDGTGVFTAANIKISEGWMNGTTTITSTTKDVTDPDATNNDNILVMIDALTAKRDFKSADGQTTYYSGNFQECYANTENMLGSDGKTNAALLKNQLSVINQISNNRDSVSGVSLDDEGMSLMHYQQSFSAAARLMTTLDEALDTLINKTGVVGR